MAAIAPYRDQNLRPLDQATQIRVQSAVAALTDATATTIVAAPAAGSRIVLLKLIQAVTTAGSTLTLKEGAGGTARAALIGPANTLNVMDFGGGLNIAAATLLEVVGKAASTQDVTAVYYIEKVALA